jgi:hypothetical protein
MKTLEHYFALWSKRFTDISSSPEAEKCTALALLYPKCTGIALLQAYKKAYRGPL